MNFIFSIPEKYRDGMTVTNLKKGVQTTIIGISWRRGRKWQMVFIFV